MFQSHQHGVVETRTKNEKTTRFNFFAAHVVTIWLCSCNIGLELLDRDLSILCQKEAAEVTSTEGGHGTTFDIACLIRITALLIPDRKSVV